MTAILIGAGGTGGHITPALATAAALHAARPDIEIEFVGTAEGLESRLVPAAGWHLHTVEALPLRRAVTTANLRVPVVVLRSAHRLRRIIADRSVAVAATFGGYVSAPLAYAAKRSSVPLLLHEQNAVPGLANRVASRWADVVAVSVGEAAARFPARAPVTITGNPVRPDLAHADLLALRPAGLRLFGLDAGRRTLLVFGGSLGARRLNDAVLASTPLWQTPDRWQVLHVAGARDYERVSAAWARAEVPLIVHCVEFVDRMELAYAVADVVVCRAGASTVAELSVLGLPSILVPYPYAAADEQRANARALADVGAALTVTDDELDGARLVAFAEPLLGDDSKRAAMAASARALGRPDAAAHLAELVLGLLRAQAAKGGAS